MKSFKNREGEYGKYILQDLILPAAHATPEAIKTLLDLTMPDTVIPIHTENPEMIKTYYPEKSTVILNDKEVFTL